MAVWIFSGGRLAVAMKVKDVSVPQLAQLCGLSNSMIEAIKGGQRQPSMTTVGRLADALGGSPADFFVQMNDRDDRPTELGPAMDAWIAQMLCIAPELTQEQADRISAALFSQEASA